jgi:hypothetical protein
MPKTWEELAIWLALQFPVLGVCAAIVWWILGWSDRHQEAALLRNTAQHEQLIGEMEKGFKAILNEVEKRIAERDARIQE